MIDAEPTGTQRLHARFLKFCRHPASILVWFCLFSLIIKEQFPFSHYPMYSGWSHRTHYFYIADDNGPIQAKTVFKVSVPRMKKLYGSIIDKMDDKKSYSEFTEDDFAAAGQTLLEKLRKGVPKKRLEGQMKDANRKRLFHPDGSPILVKDIVASDLTLVRVEIERQKKKFTTTEKAVVTTDVKNQIVQKPQP
ncbi:MAG: hypothetical protein ACI8XO_002199 [Verrucomicrobiales bacterium]|jgi:hypothetical protein